MVTLYEHDPLILLQMFLLNALHITSATPLSWDMVANSFCLGTVSFWRTNVVPCAKDMSPYYMKTLQSILVLCIRIKKLIFFTLFPLEILRFPEGDKYVVSNQPFASSPRSLKGTGYGTLNGRNFNANAALSKRNRTLLGSLMDATACSWNKEV